MYNYDNTVENYQIRKSQQAVHMMSEDHKRAARGLKQLNTEIRAAELKQGIPNLEILDKLNPKNLQNKRNITKDKT